MNLLELVTLEPTKFSLPLSASDVFGAFDGNLIVGNLQIHSYDLLSAGSPHPLGKGGDYWTLC